MVDIPTSRNVGYSGTRSGRIAPSGPSVSVGAAVSDAGRSIVQAAYNLDELADREVQDVVADRSNTVSMKLNQFLGDQEQEFLKAQDEASESGIGFTRAQVEGFRKRANEFAEANFEGLSDDEQTKYSNVLISRSNDIYAKADRYESTLKSAYYERGTSQDLDGIRTQIRANSAPFDQLHQRGIESINAKAMPDGWKAAKRAQWDADAQEERWKADYNRNPARALNALRPTAGTASLLRKEEGFRDEPYWDVNAWRIGYGSDTVTRPDGSHEAVKPGMKITREDAERDLQYRLSEREGAQARNQVGGNWSALPANVQAGLESVAYNYGSLPDNVVTAAQSGDVNAIAAAVEGLSSNPDRRKREAAIIRGDAAVPVTDDYAAIPPERRDILERQYTSQYNSQLAFDRTSARDDWALQIARQPRAQLESQIMADGRIDNGDKASLINSLHSAIREGASTEQFIAAYASGQGAVNPFDDKQRKAADGAYYQMSAGIADPVERTAFASDFVNRTKYIPASIQDQLRYGAVSRDPAMVSQTMEAASVLSKNAPQSFAAFEGSSAVQSKLDAYRAFRSLGYTTDQASRRVIDAGDPEKVRTRDAILKSDVVSKEIKKVQVADVASIFDKGALSRAPAVGGTVTQDQTRIGVNPEAESVIVADFRELFQDAVVETHGDVDAAKVIASERMKRVYGTSRFSAVGSNVVIRNPVETTYPPGPDGTHDYVRQQAIDDLRAEGVETDTIFLQPNTLTDDDIRAGRAPTYALFYEDEKGQLQRFRLPFMADVSMAQRQSEAQRNEALQQSEQRMIRNRYKQLEMQEGGPRNPRTGAPVSGLPIDVTTDKERFQEQFNDLGLSDKPRGVTPQQLGEAIGGVAKDAGDFFQGVFGEQKSTTPSRANQPRKPKP